MAKSYFGEAVILIGGERRKCHVTFINVLHSKALFIKAYPAVTTMAILNGHVSASAIFGGVLQSLPYDVTKLAVAKICGDGKRERTRLFTGLTIHYILTDRFARPLASALLHRSLIEAALNGAKSPRCKRAVRHMLEIELLDLQISDYSILEMQKECVSRTMQKHPRKRSYWCMTGEAL